MSERDVSDSTSIKLLGSLLTKVGLPHALIGGYAVNFHSEYRATLDFDLCVFPDRNAILKLKLELQEAGLLVLRYQDEDAAGSGPDYLRMANDKKNFIVDIQTAKTAYQVASSSGPRKTTSGLAVATVEDLIVLKLIANRPRDLRDIDKLLDWNEVDWQYIEHWAEIWDVTDRMTMMRDAQGDNHP